MDRGFHAPTLAALGRIYCSRAAVFVTGTPVEPALRLEQRDVIGRINRDADEKNVLALCRSKLFCARRFNQSLRQVTMPVHGPTHDGVAFDHFVEKDVLFERAKHDKETSVAKPRVIESAARSKLRMLTEKSAGRFHRGR